MPILLLHAKPPAYLCGASSTSSVFLFLFYVVLFHAKPAICLRGASSIRRLVATNLASSLLPEEEQRLVDLYERATQYTLFISRTRLAFNPVMMNVLEGPSQAGSGFLWDDAGKFVVTNAHVVGTTGGSNSVGDVLVTMVGGKTLKAKIRGLDAARDVAVLELSDEAQTQLQKGIARGSSAGLRVGQTAIAIGNPFGLDLTMTRGIVSGLGRTVGIGSSSTNSGALFDMIQVDCAINPGNSGGPLLDSSGNLIGMNTAIYSTSGASAGIGFAIPVDALKTFVEILIRDGKLAPVKTGLRGIPYRFFSASASSSTSSGLLVVGVERGSAAEVAGLRASPDPELADIVLACNTLGVSSQTDLDRAFFIAAAAGQNIVTLLVERRISGGIGGGEKKERIKTEIRMELRR